MDLLSGNISRLIFRQKIHDQLENVSLDTKLLSFFLQLDGIKSLGAVAAALGLSMVEIREAAGKLLKLELIEPVDAPAEFIDSEFLAYLNSQLSKAIGPIAPVLVEEEMNTIAGGELSFPAAQIPELIETLSRDINRPDKKKEFQVNMINKMKEKGY